MKNFTEGSSLKEIFKPSKSITPMLLKPTKWQLTSLLFTVKKSSGPDFWDKFQAPKDTLKFLMDKMFLTSKSTGQQKVQFQE